MRVRLNFVPSGTRKHDYSLAFELPSIPQPGDYISVRRPPKTANEVPGTYDFIVKRTRWRLSYPDNDTYKDADDPTCGKVDEIVVDCDFALSYWSCEEHKRDVKGSGSNLQHE